jgi:hypothetical protein
MKEEMTQNDGWRAVTPEDNDNLPELEMPVWLWFEEIEQALIGCRTLDDGGWYWARCYDDWHWNGAAGKWETGTAELDDLKPTHWMPLPAPPLNRTEDQ